MQVTINLPETFTIARRDGTSVTVETGKLHANALPYLFGYGVKQSVSDSASSAENADEASEMMGEKIAALYSGDIRIQSERTGDAVLRETLAVVLPAIKKLAQKQGHKVSGKDAVKASVLRGMAIEFLGDRNSPPNAKAAEAWAKGRKRAEELAFSIES